MLPLDPSGVDLDPARCVDGDHRRTGDGAYRLRRPLPQPRASADADDAVQDDVGRGALAEVDQAPTAGSQCRESALVERVRDGDRLDPCAPTSQHRAGVQRVATVVARTDEQQDPAPVGTARAGR